MSQYFRGCGIGGRGCDTLARMRLKADLILLFTALLWGFGFIAQRTAAAEVGPFLFNASRWILGVVVILPFMRFKLKITRESLPWTLAAGTVLFMGNYLQQAGLASTTAGNAGFITGAYVVLIPILLAMFWRERTSPVIWLAALVTAGGIYLLSMSGPISFNKGDLLVLIGAFMWALHVIITGKAVQHVEVMPFVVGQYIVSAVLNLIFGLAFEAITLPGLLPNWMSIVYLAVFSTGLGFTLQAYGQRHAPAADAAIIMSMEAVFAALFGWLFLREALTPYQLLGCGLILLAIILSQVVTVHRNNQAAVG